MTQLANSSPPGIAPPRLATVYDSFKDFVDQSVTWLLKSRIFVETDKAIPVGTSVRAEISLAHGPVLIRGLGEVAQVQEPSEDDDQEAGVALRVIYLDPASARLISSVLRHQGHQEKSTFAVAKSFPTPAGAVVRGIPEGWGESDKAGSENWETDVGSFVDEALQEPGFAADDPFEDGESVEFGEPVELGEPVEVGEPAAELHDDAIEPEWAGTDDTYEEETLLEETIEEGLIEPFGEPTEPVGEAATDGVDIADVKFPEKGENGALELVQTSCPPGGLEQDHRSIPELSVTTVCRQLRPGGH